MIPCIISPFLPLPQPREYWLNSNSLLVLLSSETDWTCSMFPFEQWDGSTDLPEDVFLYKEKYVGRNGLCSTIRRQHACSWELGCFESLRERPWGDNAKDHRVATDHTDSLVPLTDELTCSCCSCYCDTVCCNRHANHRKPPNTATHRRQRGEVWQDWDLKTTRW